MAGIQNLRRSNEILQPLLQLEALAAPVEIERLW